MFSAADCDSALIPADSKANFFIHVLTKSEAVSRIEFVKSVPAVYLELASESMQAFILVDVVLPVVAAESAEN